MAAKSEGPVSSSAGSSTAGSLRSVSLFRTGPARLRVTNVRGGAIDIGRNDTDFTPLELLLAAIGACTGLDVEVLTSRRAEPVRFELSVTADKIRDEGGNRLTNIEVLFDTEFPDGDGGDAARALLPDAIRRSHDRLCTVSRTVELGTPIRSGVRS